MSALALRTLTKTLRSTNVSSIRAFHSTVRRNKHFLNANEETFENAIANKDSVVLVDFYADWCGPCKMLSPILDKLTTDPSMKSGSGLPFDLVTVDTDTETELSVKYKIRALPTVVAFKDGQPVGQFTGALPEANIRHFLTTL